MQEVPQHLLDQVEAENAEWVANGKPLGDHQLPHVVTRPEDTSHGIELITYPVSSDNS